MEFAAKSPICCEPAPRHSHPSSILRGISVEGSGQSYYSFSIDFPAQSDFWQYAETVAGLADRFSGPYSDRNSRVGRLIVSFAIERM